MAPTSKAPEYCLEPTATANKGLGNRACTARPKPATTSGYCSAANASRSCEPNSPTASTQINRLHAFYVVIFVVGHRMRDFARLERRFQIQDRVAYCSLGLKSKLAINFFGRYMIRPMIIGGRYDDLDVVPNRLARHIGDLANFEVVISSIPDLSVHGRVISFQQTEIEISHVLDVEIRTQLLPAKNGNSPIRDGEISQNVDREI